MRYIDSLKDGMQVSEVYLCKSKQIAQTKAGKDYGNIILQDKTGTIDSKIWDLTSPGIEDFDTLDYVHVDAEVRMFQGSNQLNIRRIRRADPREYVPSDYVPVSSKDVDEMYKELLGYVNSLKDPYLKALAEEFFVNDEEFIKEFRSHSAAKSIHHGFVGGLLEHTLNVVRLCDFYSSQYPDINRDLIITAAMLHDVGKVKELSDFPENDYTDEGQLLGHIVIGAEMASDKMKKIPNFPEKLANEVQHCILSHHGELEYGSPKKPALLEAIALSYADNTDAKIETMVEALHGAGDNNGWLGFNRPLDSNIRKT